MSLSLQQSWGATWQWYDVNKIRWEEFCKSHPKSFPYGHYVSEGNPWQWLVSIFWLQKKNPALLNDLKISHAPITLSMFFHLTIVCHCHMTQKKRAPLCSKHRTGTVDFRVFNIPRVGGRHHWMNAYWIKSSQRHYVITGLIWIVYYFLL